jgi:hypothetical protein
LGINRELGVSGNVDKENVRDFQLDLFFKLGGISRGEMATFQNHCRLDRR